MSRTNIAPEKNLGLYCTVIDLRDMTLIFFFLPKIGKMQAEFQGAAETRCQKYIFYRGNDGQNSK